MVWWSGRLDASSAAARRSATMSCCNTPRNSKRFQTSLPDCLWPSNAPLDLLPLRVSRSHTLLPAVCAATAKHNLLPDCCLLRLTLFRLSGAPSSIHSSSMHSSS